MKRLLFLASLLLGLALLFAPIEAPRVAAQSFPGQTSPGYIQIGQGNSGLPKWLPITGCTLTSLGALSCPAGSIAVGSTPITSGVTSPTVQLLTDSGGTLGEVTKCNNGAFQTNGTGVPSCGLLPWSVITSTPTTLSGYGITNGAATNLANTFTNTNIFTGPTYMGGSGAPWADVKSGANGCAAAVGNNSNDDSGAIQCQANWLHNNIGGGFLKFPCGNYFTNATKLSIPTGVILIGSGRQCTYIITGNTDVTGLEFTFTGGSNYAGMRDLTVICDTTAGALVNNCVQTDVNTSGDMQNVIVTGGKFAYEMDGSEWHLFNTHGCGVGTSSGGCVTSTGANYYTSCGFDGNSVSVGFMQGTNSSVMENQIENCDFSGTYTNSLVINDGGNHTAITKIIGGIFSSPIIITSAKSTMISTAELGSSTLTFNDGTLSVTNSTGTSSAVAQGGSATNVICRGNINITCNDHFNNSVTVAVNLNTSSTYVDGPSVAQGTAGLWFASGTAQLTGSNGDYVECKLWDGTTVIDSGSTSLGNGLQGTVPLSGYLLSPAGNLKISCVNITAARGTIATSTGATAKASTLSAFRLQ